MQAGQSVERSAQQTAGEEHKTDDRVGQLHAAHHQGTTSSAVLGPRIVPLDLLLLLWGEVVDNTKLSTDLLWRLALDEFRHRLGGQVQQGLDVEVVGSLQDPTDKRESEQTK